MIADEYRNERCCAPSVVIRFFSQQVRMRQFPSEDATQFQTFKNPIPRIEKIRTQLPIAFDQGPQPCASFVRLGGTPRRGSESDQMLQARQPPVRSHSRPVVR